MLDHRRVDVARLNQLARQRMWAAGRLGTEALVVGDREFRAGDWVVCGRNAMTAHSGDLGVANGTKGYVTGLDPQRGEPTVRLDQPGEPLEVTLPRWYLAGRLPDGRRALDHAYATTCEKSQGATYDRGFARAGAHATQNWAYVAATRIRDRIDLEAMPLR
jgi:ATP-dependent exoDNAse (exonuclease V) alpha subunit